MESITLCTSINYSILCKHRCLNCSRERQTRNILIFSRIIKIPNRTVLCKRSCRTVKDYRSKTVSKSRCRNIRTNTILETVSDHINNETVTTDFSLTCIRISLTISIIVINPRTVTSRLTSSKINTVLVIRNNLHCIFVDAHKNAGRFSICIYTLLDIKIITLLVSKIRDDRTSPRTYESNTLSLRELINLILQDTL